MPIEFEKVNKSVEPIAASLNIILNIVHMHADARYVTLLLCVA